MHIHLPAPGSTPKPRNDCHYQGGVYKFRERKEIGCEQICHCDEGGIMNCRPRCPERNHTRADKCVYVKDPKDVCCQLELCDVTLDDHEQQQPLAPILHNGGGLNSIGEDAEQQQERSYGLEPQARDAGAVGTSCNFKGIEYEQGQQFRDGCDQLCICNEQGVHCAKVECPSTFGLDVLNPHCIRWEPVPADFKPVAPHCCPESMRCVDNGTCSYQGMEFDNWSPIPTNLTGKLPKLRHIDESHLIHFPLHPIKVARSIVIARTARLNVAPLARLCWHCHQPICPVILPRHVCCPFPKTIAASIGPVPLWRLRQATPWWRRKRSRTPRKRITTSQQSNSPPRLMVNMAWKKQIHVSFLHAKY